jgi:hypothetical protein
MEMTAIILKMPWKIWLLISRGIAEPAGKSAAAPVREVMRGGRDYVTKKR